MFRKGQNGTILMYILEKGSKKMRKGRYPFFLHKTTTTKKEVGVGGGVTVMGESETKKKKKAPLLAEDTVPR